MQQNNGCKVLWKHLVDLYERDCMGKGIRACHGPKIEAWAHQPHLIFKNASRLCSAGIYNNRSTYYLYHLFYIGLSESVSNALTLTGGEETKETAKLVTLMHKFWYFTTSMKKRRFWFSYPYRHSSGFRLDVIYSYYFMIACGVTLWGITVARRHIFFHTLINGKLVWRVVKDSISPRKKGC